MREIWTNVYGQDHHKAMTEPNRMRKQSESVLKAIAKLTHDLHKLAQKKSNCGRGVLNNSATLKDAAELCDNLLHKVALHKHAVLRRRTKVDAVLSSLEVVSSRAQELSTVSFHSSLLSNDASRQTCTASQSLARTRATCEIIKRACFKKTAAVVALADVLPALGTHYSECEDKLHCSHAANAVELKQIKSIREEVDMTVGRLLFQENKQQTEMQILESVANGVAQFENEMAFWTAEGRRQGKLIAALITEEDVATREATRIQEAEALMRSDITMMNLSILDLTKALVEMRRRLREFSALYEAVKNERTKYSSLCQSLSQALAEVKEKVRILSDEIFVLRNESCAKEQALALELSQHLSSQSRRDCLRLELFRCQGEYRRKQKLIEQHSIVIQKLNAVINYTENQIMRYKCRYEAAIELRDKSGVILVDRNDELCVFYEKINIQDQSIQYAEMRFRGKMADLKVLRCCTSKTQSTIQVSQYLSSMYHSYIKAVGYLRSQLGSEQETSIFLCRRLERPSESGRWRMLHKKHREEDSFLTRIRHLDRHLSLTIGDSVECDLVLEELLRLVSNLQLNATSDSRSIPRRAREFQALRSALSRESRHMCAAITELAMYRASAVRLLDIRTRLEMRSPILPRRTSSSEHLSHDTVVFLRRHGHRKKIVHNDKQTAEISPQKRPNAYVPVASNTGIPLPYGPIAPFKPSEIGTRIREAQLPSEGITL